VNTNAPGNALDVTGDEYVSGNINAVANVTGGNLTTAGIANVGTLAVIGAATVVGNITGGNLTTAGIANVGTLAVTNTVTAGNLATTGTLTVAGSTTLGDAAGDILTINGNSVSIPNNLNFDSNTFFIDATNNRVGVNTNAPGNALDVTGAAYVSSTLTTAGNITTSNTVIATEYKTASNAMTISGNSIVSSGSGITIDPSGGGALDGNVFLLGNLQVSGNITSVDFATATTSNLVWQSANNAINAAAASGGGLEVGNIASPYASLLFNSVSNTWVTNIGLNVTGALNATGTATVNALTSNGAFSGTTIGGTTGTFSSTLNVASTATVNALTSNGAISGTTGTFNGTLNATGTATVNALTSNGAISGTTIGGTTGTFSSTLNVASTATVNALTSNGAISGTTIGGTTGTFSSTLNVASTATVNALTSNGAISAGSFTTAGSANIGNSVGVGIAPSGVAGEIRAVGQVQAFVTSDISFKENIADISNALSTVTNIGGKTFDWTDDYIRDHGGEDGFFVVKHDFGVIAQDVQAVFPLATRTRIDGTLAVDYEKLSALAFAAIKEQNEVIADLISRIEKLESKK
jgi:hypothetical protein